jgi:transcriptional regulator with XRE-family HTH domain
VDARHHFGHNLRALRLETGMTQEALGLASGVHPTVVSRLERGERDPRISTIIKLAAALEVSPGDLLDRRP